MVTNGQNTSAFILSLLIFVFKCAHSLIHVNWTNDDIHENQQLQSLLKVVKPVIFYKVMHVLTDHPIRYGDQQQRCDDKNGNLQHQNTAGIRKVHYMYSRCSDWSIVGTTQSEIPLSCHSITCATSLRGKNFLRGRLSDAFLGRVRAVTKATYQSVLSSEK